MSHTPEHSPLTVLVVDDEAPIRRSLEVTLMTQGYRVVIAPTGEAAISAAANEHPDLVLLDLGLPGVSGLDVIAALRGWTSIPIVVLSARHDDRDKVRALDAGADDYVTKPFSMSELLARVRSGLRRARTGPIDHVVERPNVVTDDFTIDLAGARVVRGGSDVRLTPTEWHLVEILARNPGRLLTHQFLLQEVWGPEYGSETNYLRVFMAQIRAKLEPVPSSPRYFHTEAGMGYRFEDRGDSRTPEEP